MSTDTRARAARLLGLPEAATPDEATAAFLTALPAADFLPAGWAVAALNEVAGTNVPAGADATEAAGLGEVVEGFVRDYWSLPPAARRAAWAALAARRPDPATAARLAALEPGLDLDAADLDGEVGDLTRELFLLPPRDRAVRRNEWLAANAYRHPVLTCGADLLRSTQPGAVALDPVLFARLDSSFAAARFASAVADDPVVAAPRPVAPPPPPAPPPPTPAPFPFPPPAPPRPRPYRAPAAADSETGKNIAGAVIGIIFFVCWLSFKSSRSDSRYVAPTFQYTIPTFKYTIPTFQYTMPTFRYEPYRVPTSPSFEPYRPPTVQRSFGRTVFTPDEVRRYQAYLSNPTGTPPSGYFDWLAAGAPGGFGAPTLPRFPGTGR